MLLKAATASSSTLSSTTFLSSPLSPRLRQPSLVISTASTPHPALHVVSSSSVPQEVSRTITGVVFEPFVEVKSQLVNIPSTSSLSFARQSFSPNCEAAINVQINIEYSISYVYHDLYAYFDRDNVGLPGFANFFKASSEEERSHAEKLMKYQDMRGGRVKLQCIQAPVVTEFDNEEKGDALNAMEIALGMEKLVNEKLLQLHKVAEEECDPQLQDFIEGEFLKSQVEDIKKISQYVSQLRRVGQGYGVYHFDLVLQGEAA